MKLYCTLVVLICLSGCCRYDFTVRRSIDQGCVFKAKTAEAGEREFLLQYDADQGVLYSRQNFSTNGLSATIRKYALTGDVESEWNVPIWLGEFVAAAIQDNELYLADHLPLHGSCIDNLCVFDLTSGLSGSGEVRPLKGVLPASVSCHGIVPLGKMKLLLKLLNTATLVPSIVVFDCQTSEIINAIDLRSTGSEFVWNSCWLEYLVEVSPDRSRFLLRDGDGVLAIFNEYADKMFCVKLSDLLSVSDSRVGSDPSHLSKHVGIDWVDARTVVLWSDWDGRWWHYDVDERKVVDKGRIRLRERSGDASDSIGSLQTKEEIRRILGPRRFLVKGFNEGLFSKDGYMVTINADGTETREKIGWGTWPVKMLTEELYFAEEF